LKLFTFKKRAGI